MDIVVLVKSIVGLVALLGLLVLLLLYSPKAKKARAIKKQKKEQEKPHEYTFNELLAIIRNRESSSQELELATKMILKHYGKIPHKMGIRVADEFYAYSEILMRLCRHPNITKDILLHFDKELRKLNPEYEKELNDAFTKGINSRGI